METDHSEEQTLDRLIADHREDLDQLITFIGTLDGGTECFRNDDMEVIALRFLLGYHGVEEAQPRLAALVEFRKKFDAPNLPDFDETSRYNPHPLAQISKRMMGYQAFHGWALDGNPITLSRVGSTKPDLYMDRISLAEHEEILSWGTITEQRELNRLSREKNMLLKNVIIIDLAGLSMSHLSYREYLNLDLSIPQRMSPESLRRTIVINAPSFFNTIWKIVKPLVDPVIIEKTQLYGNSGYEDEIRSLMPSQNLPEDFGGTCDCGYPACRGVIDEQDEKFFVRSYSISSGQIEEESIIVSAPIEVAIGVNCSKKDIGLRCSFIPEKTNVEELWDNPGRITTDDRRYRKAFLISTPGTFKIQFDNSYARWHSKDVSLVVQLREA